MYTRREYSGYAIVLLAKVLRHRVPEPGCSLWSRSRPYCRRSRWPRRGRVHQLESNRSTRWIDTQGIALRIGVDLALGAAIGLDRQWRSSPIAGLRTAALVSLGSTLFVIMGG